jgi:hypothetical protein
MAVGDREVSDRVQRTCGVLSHRIREAKKSVIDTPNRLGGLKFILEAFVNG